MRQYVVRRNLLFNLIKIKVTIESSFFEVNVHIHGQVKLADLIDISEFRLLLSEKYVKFHSLLSLIQVEIRGKGR